MAKIENNEKRLGATVHGKIMKFCRKVQNAIKMLTENS